MLKLHLSLHIISEIFFITDLTREGSGSLLLAVGDTFEKASHQKGKVKYYYQELVKETYNMCRQNLVMRGINPSNMVGRNGDTLGFDYPYFDDSVKDPQNTYYPVFVDAVVANPPYSQKYSKKDIENSPRFAEYGMPPESKADLAFLLHGLYHLKSDGSQVIVLPHGVLFRNEELQIRRTLIVNVNRKMVYSYYRKMVHI